MGLFNRNENTNDEMLIILGEIRDNLRMNNDDILVKLEGKIADAKYNNDEELGVIHERLTKLEKTVELQDKEINLLRNKLADYDSVFNEIFKKLDESKPVIKKLKSEKNVIRAYGKNWTEYGQIKLDNIECLTKDGKFKRNGRGINYFVGDIHTLLKLKSIMKKENEYPTQKSLTNAIGLSAITVMELGYYILNGDFDKYFNEWEQIQADQTFKKGWKPSIENNPEKRVEQGIYG